MTEMVQARLDEESSRLLAQLVRATGKSRSEIVREALRGMAACHPMRGKSRVAGLGKFESGVPDLGSNKSHLKAFGG
ncbi:MAG: CopG family transcriptional regulator [Acidobacteria bacterium]|nr:CopG family transcriptional regulator [Acidobacteriota bacterium]